MSATTASEEGTALVHDPPVTPREPKPKGVGPQVDPDQDFTAAMRLLIAHRWGEVWRTIPVALAGHDVEGVHDVRVASRRLRAAMDVAVDCFPADWYRPLHKTAAAITKALGEVRDRDVLLGALTAERAAAPTAEWPGIDRLIDRIEAERVVARAEMETFLADLLRRGVPDEATRRFGQGAAPPDSLRPAVAAAAGEAREESR